PKQPTRLVAIRLAARGTTRPRSALRRRCRVPHHPNGLFGRVPVAARREDGTWAIVAHLTERQSSGQCPRLRSADRSVKGQFCVGVCQGRHLKERSYGDNKKKFAHVYVLQSRREAAACAPSQQDK